MLSRSWGPNQVTALPWSRVTDIRSPRKASAKSRPRRSITDFQPNRGIMKITKRKFPGGASVVALAVTLFAPRLMAGSAIDPDADLIFRASCKYLAEAKGFCVKVEVWEDMVLPNGPKVQTTRTLEVQEQRPDQIHIEVRSPRDSRGFWYQNKSLTMLDRTINLYGVMEVPEDIDKVIDAVEEHFGIEIPLGDVLVADPYRNMMDSMETADDFGKVTVLGVLCNHLAF